MKGHRDERVDEYIGKAAAFAKPILNHLRELVHKAYPEIQETIKWGFPHFEYEGVVCSMAAFKQHCAFGFWKDQLMEDPHKLFGKEDAMGSLGKIRSLQDLPADKILVQYVKEAVKLNEEGTKIAHAAMRTEDNELIVPDYFMGMLRRNKQALAIFEKFSFTNKKEYVEWVTEAKSEETRKRRLTTAVEWIAEGKSRHWKYSK